VREGHWGFRRTEALPIFVVDTYFWRESSSKDYIPQPRPLPNAIHHRTVKPIDALHFFEQRPHRVAAIAGALERTCYGVLFEFCTEIFDCE